MKNTSLPLFAAIYGLLLILPFALAQAPPGGSDENKPTGAWIHEADSLYQCESHPGTATDRPGHICFTRGCDKKMTSMDAADMRAYRQADLLACHDAECAFSSKKSFAPVNCPICKGKLEKVEKNSKASAPGEDESKPELHLAPSPYEVELGYAE